MHFKTSVSLLLCMLSFSALALDDGQRLLFAACRGELKTVKEELEKGIDPNLPVAVYGGDELPLVCASQSLHIEIVKLLVENKANVNLGNAQGTTPLMAVSSLGQNDESVKSLQLITYLIQNGADLHSKDKYGRTALIYSFGRYSTNVSKFLLDLGAKADSAAFNLAVLNFKLPYVKLLLTYRAKVEDVILFHGYENSVWTYRMLPKF